MNIRWNHDTVTFETIREADIWADSIANDIYGRIYEGYTTPDYKIAYALAFVLASVPEFIVHTGTKYTSTNENLYKVWITMSDIECAQHVK